MRYGFGVDLGGTTVKIAYFDERGTLLSKWEIPTITENNGEKVLPDIAASVLSCIKENNISVDDVLGIGIGVPGAVDRNGVVAGCDNLGWGRTDVQTVLKDLTGLPVKAGNDATVAALGECWKGSGNGCDNMVFITLGTGVGGGIIIDGKPLYGMSGAAGEIGHIVLNRSETRTCGCGKRGCVEQYCSATGIVRMAKDYLEQNPVESALRGPDAITCKDVFRAAEDHDAAAITVLEQVYAYMAEFIANICAVVNPDKIVIGGGVSKAGQPLLDGIKRYIGRCIYHAAADVKFELASLGNDAGVYGAVKLILE